MNGWRVRLCRDDEGKIYAGGRKLFTLDAFQVRASFWGVLGLHVTPLCHPDAGTCILPNYSEGQVEFRVCGVCGALTPYPLSLRAVTIWSPDLVESWARVHFDPLAAALAVPALSETLAREFPDFSH